MWLYLHFRRTRRAVMAARVLAAGGDTSNSSSRRLIVLALVISPRSGFRPGYSLHKVRLVFSPFYNLLTNVFPFQTFTNQCGMAQALKDATKNRSALTPLSRRTHRPPRTRWRVGVTLSLWHLSVLRLCRQPSCLAVAETSSHWLSLARPCPAWPMPSRNYISHRTFRNRRMFLCTQVAPPLWTRSRRRFRYPLWGRALRGWPSRVWPLTAFIALPVTPVPTHSLITSRSSTTTTANPPSTK